MVLEVDKERHRLSLGLKASYFADIEEPAQQQEVGPNLGLHTWVLQAADDKLLCWGCGQH